MAKDFQIVTMNETGIAEVLHPETNADNIDTGVVHKVPTIAEIKKWSDIRTEVIEARAFYSSLSLRFREIDKKIEDDNIFNIVKGLDGTGSGLDADKLDGFDVDDSSTNGIWTSAKTKEELDKRVINTDVVSSPSANKILRLNRNGVFEVDVNGNSSSSTKLQTPLSINFIGKQVNGKLSFSGDEGRVETQLTVLDDSHNHSKISKGNSSLEVVNDEVLFKTNNREIAKISSTGNFSGTVEDAEKVNGFSVNNEAIKDSLWTSDKILELINSLGETKVDEGEQEIVIGGLIRIKYGTVNLSAPNRRRSGAAQQVSFNTPFTKLLFDGFNVETIDETMIITKRPNGSNNTGLTYLLNKTPIQETNIKWFAVGI